MGTHLYRDCLLSLAVVLALLAPQKISDGPARRESHLIFWNIGQGDFMSLVTPQGCWSFDVGGSFLLPLKDLTFLRDSCPGRRMEIFISHFDKDHIRNVGRLGTQLVITHAYFSHLQPRTQFGRRLLESLKAMSTEVHEIRSGFTKKLGNFHLRCLWPPPLKPLGKSENERSLVLYIEGAHKKILVTGDFPGKLERQIKLSAPEIPIDILKVAHHGSRSSSTDKFLETLNAKTCVVSVGAHNTYGHPTPQTLQRLKMARCSILRTDRLGTIDFRDP